MFYVVVECNGRHSFVVECGIACFLCTNMYSKYGHHPYPLGYLCAKFFISFAASIAELAHGEQELS